jgi:hypothetical protein
MTLDYAKMKAIHETYSRSSGGFFRPESGQNNIRLLPGWEGSDVSFVFAVDHFIGGDVNQSYFCLGMPGLEQVCPMCIVSKRLKKNPDPNVQEMGNSIAPKKVFLWNLIVRNKETEGPKVFKAGRRIHDQFMDYVLDLVHYPDILNVRNGIDMILKKEGQGKMVTYRVQILQQRSMLMRTEAETLSLFAQARNLEQEVHFESVEKLEKILAKFQGFDEMPSTPVVSAGVLPVAVPPYSPPPGVFPHVVESVAGSVPVPVEAPAPPAFLGMSGAVAGPVAAPVVVTPPSTPIAAPPVLVPTPVGPVTAPSSATPAPAPVVPPLPVAGAEPPKIDLKSLRERVSARMAKTGGA